MLYKSFPGTVELWCQALEASREVQGINSLFAVADCWGWDALRCRSNIGHSASLQPYSKPARWVMHALNGTLPNPFIFLWKFIRRLHACLQASHWRDQEETHTCNVNQLNPVDVELTMRWISLISFSVCFEAVCVLKWTSSSKRRINCFLSRLQLITSLPSGPWEAGGLKKKKTGEK